MIRFRSVVRPLTLVLAVGLAGSIQAQTPGKRNKPSLPDFDMRGNAAAHISPLADRRRAGLEQSVRAMRATFPGLRAVANRFGLPKFLLRDRAVLSGPSAQKPEDNAREFLRAHPSLFPLSPAELNGLRVLVNDAGPAANFVTLGQTVGGIDVFNGHIRVVMTKAGEVAAVSTADVVPGLSLSTRPRIDAGRGALAALRACGDKRTSSLTRLARPDGKIAFHNPKGSPYNPVTTELVIFPVDDASARLAYRVFAEMDGDSWYEVLIDASDGSLLFRHNLHTSIVGQGSVWLQSPMVGTRPLVSFPEAWLPKSPNSSDKTGWVTTGNNVDAYLSTGTADTPDTYPRTATMVGGRAYATNAVFDFPYGDGLIYRDPRNFQSAAVANLFYFVNIAHDYFYGLGFTETSANFQTLKFGKSAKANDAVIAEAQQGAEINNSSFSPTPEGTPPRMRIGLMTRGTSELTDDLDMDYDGQAVVHEYTHGVSNRLVGAGVSTSCLMGLQSGAMGEGWSDYFAISYFNDPVFGAYPAHNPVTGIRRQSYEGYTYTYEDVGNGPHGYEVHDDGEIWAAALWDLRKSLGQTVTDLLVTNGLKGTPCDPSMTDARDAILAADQAANNGANRAQIWQVFARHGMGYSAFGADGSTMTGSRYDAAYDLPPDLQASANPAVTSDPLAVSTDAGSNYSYTVSATNPNGGTLNFKLISGPSGMHIDSATGAITWTAAFTNQRVKISVTDGKGGSVIHGFDLPVFTHLTTGSPLTISGDAYSYGFASFSLPEGVTLLQVTLRGSGGDADIFVMQPNGQVDVSENDGDDETLSFVSPAAGEWQILVMGYKWYSGVTLQAAAVTPQPLNIRGSLTGLTAIQTSESSYKITIPPGAISFSVTASGGTGDVDLYLRKGLPAICQPFNSVSTECQYDQKSESAGNSEFIAVNNPAPGDWYLDLSAYEDYSGVTLTTAIAGPPALIVDQAALPFTGEEDGPAPPAQAIDLTNLATGAYAWTAQVATAAGGDWLAIDKTSGQADSTLSVSVQPAGLKAGVYNGTVTLTAPGLANSPITVAVTLTLTAAPVLPVIKPDGVLNGASFQPVISAGSWVSILGSDLSVQTGDWGGAIVNGVLPAQLDGVSVTVGGLPAYINYVSPTQINIQAPDVPEGPAEVIVTNAFGTSVPYTALISRESPAFFLWLGKYAVATHLDYSLAVAPETFPGAGTVAAKPSEVLILWATGLGPTSPPVPAGIQVPGDRQYSTADTVEVTVGGTSAQVYGAALSPGFVGLYQVAIQVPSGLADGEYPIQVKAGAAVSPANVYLSVQH